MDDNIRTNEPLQDGSLRLQNLTCKYVTGGALTRWLGRTKEGGEVLSNFKLEVPPKSVVAILGPSGCGKSTLLYSLGLPIPLEHPAMKSGATLEATGKLNGLDMASTTAIKGYVSQHFELIDEPLRGKRVDGVRHFLETITGPREKRSRGLLFSTHYMSRGLLEAVDVVLVMDNPPLIGNKNDAAIQKRLALYFKDAESNENARQLPFADITPERESVQHERGMNDLISTRFANEITQGRITPDEIRTIYQEQVKIFDGEGIRMFLPSVCYGKARDVILERLEHGK